MPGPRGGGPSKINTRVLTSAWLPRSRLVLPLVSASSRCRRVAVHTVDVRLISLGMAVVAVAVLAACASSNGPKPAASANPSAGSAVTSSTTSSGPTAAQNKAAAQAEADRLVAMATLPPGSVRETVQPVGLTGPAMGTPGTTQLIDSIAYYRVSMSLPRAHSWFVAHPQHGFTLSGTASGAGRSGPTSYGFGYDPPSPHSSWGTSSLDIGLASAGPAAAAVRVDAVAQWIDPSPTRDRSRGRAIRVTISGGCPTTDRGWTDVRNPGAPDLDRQLLPVGTPSRALQCTYNGVNGKAFTLTNNLQLDAAKATTAAEQIRALPLGSRGLLPHGCPMADGRATIFVFKYAGRADVDIWQYTSGCPSTKNGHIVSGDN